MGASRPLIMFAFIVQGTVNGVLGGVIGAVLGSLVATNLTGIIKSIEHVFGLQFLDANVYFIDFIPSQIHWPDITAALITALVLSFVATLYPAWRATKIDPAKVLGHV